VTYLLDTCTFVWLCAEPGQLSDAARQAVDEPDADVVLSDVSTLELTLKWSAGKIVLPEPPRTWVERQAATWGLRTVSIARDDMYRASELPDNHRDPFDRLLIATALSRGAILLTPDKAIQRYPVGWRW
jgi:PIN domain nuclease of toxin-antitoxin system